MKTPIAPRQSYPVGAQCPPMAADLVIYGAYGYTGSLIAETAVDRGLAPILAGRNRERLTDLAQTLDCAHEVVALDESQALDALLDDATAVLHCAGPFIDTAQPMLDACLRTGTHYLDITGEIPVLASLAAQSERAVEAKITVLPAVAHDVVPTDCLAAHLSERLPEATSLALAFEASGGLSPGTAHSLVEHIDGGGAVRRDGAIERVAPAHETGTVDFGWDAGERTVAAIPWGDVVTAYYTTGIPNVSVSLSMPPSTIRWYRLAGKLGPILGTAPAQRLLHWLVDRRVEGPDERERATTETYVHGVARAPDGDRVEARLRCPNTYETSRLTAVEIAERTLDDPPAAGFRTPAGVYGPDLILEATDAESEDVDPAQRTR